MRHPTAKQSEAKVVESSATSRVAGENDYRKRIGIYLLILATLIGLYLFINAPQCPEHYTQEQIDASRCIVGANIGLGLYVVFAVPVSIVVLGLLAVAVYKQYGRSAAGDLRHVTQPDRGTATAAGGGHGSGPSTTERPASDGADREDKMTVQDTSLESDTPRSNRGRRRRWPWITGGLVAVVLLLLGIGTAIFQFGLPWWMEEGDRNYMYKSDAGSLRYQVHIPPQFDGTVRLPVIMAIHGCGMTGFGLNSMKSTTQFNSLADTEGFIVIYPTQRMFRNALNCWNSADPREQHRHNGDPALLAGVAREVVEMYNADPDQVHVVGASSGAGTAIILAATYPDIFATAASVAGGEYGLNQVDPDDPESTPPNYTARQAWAQMGDRARQVPLLVIQGEDDDVVPPLVATRLVEHWTAVSDLVDDGLLNDSLDLGEESSTVPRSEHTHAYMHTTITTADGRSVVEFYLVHDMEHTWPGPAGKGLFTDRAGPDASAIVWDFAKRHPKGSSR